MTPLEQATFALIAVVAMIICITVYLCKLEKTKRVLAITDLIHDIWKDYNEQRKD